MPPTATFLLAFHLPTDTTGWPVLAEAPVRVVCGRPDGVAWCVAWGDADAEPQYVGRIIEDRAHYPDYYAHVSRSEVYPDGSFHMVIDYPALITDRDLVVLPSRSQDGDALVYTWRSVTRPEAPPQDGVIRLPEASGEWRIEPRLGGGSVIRYTWHAELGGDLPEALLARVWAGTCTEVVAGTARAAERASGRAGGL